MICQVNYHDFASKLVGGALAHRLDLEELATSTSIRVKGCFDWLAEDA